MLGTFKTAGGHLAVIDAYTQQDHYTVWHGTIGCPGGVVYAEWRDLGNHLVTINLSWSFLGGGPYHVPSLREADIIEPAAQLDQELHKKLSAGNIKDDYWPPHIQVKIDPEALAGALADGVAEMPDPDSIDEFLDSDGYKMKEDAQIKCECGADTVGDPFHYAWCSKATK